MSKLWTRLDGWQVVIFDRPLDGGFPSQPSQRQKNNGLTELDRSVEKRLALFHFFAGGLVVGRSTTADIRHDTIGQLQSVLAVSRQWLVGKSGPVQGSKQPVSASIAREHPTGSVRTVSTGSQSDHQQPGRQLSEVDDGFAPVFLVRVRFSFDFGDVATVLDQPITFSAAFDAAIQTRPCRPAQPSDPGLSVTDSPSTATPSFIDSSDTCRSRNLFFTFR